MAKRYLKLALDDVVARVNESGEGLWDVFVETEDKGDCFDVWLIDRNEFLTSENFMEDWIWRAAIYPIENAVQEQTGDDGFYFDAYDYAGRFVGSVVG